MEPGKNELAPGIWDCKKEPTDHMSLKCQSGWSSLPAIIIVDLRGLISHGKCCSDVDVRIIGNLQ